METKLEQLFKSFCSSDTSLLDHLTFQKPFMQNGNVWATDKKVALCLSKAHCDFDADIDYINIGHDVNYPLAKDQWALNLNKREQ